MLSASLLEEIKLTIASRVRRLNSRHHFTMMSADGNEVRIIFERLGYEDFIVESIVEGVFRDEYAKTFKTCGDALKHAAECMRECYAVA